MATRTLEIQIIGDPDSFTRATRRVGRDADRMGRDIEHSGKRISASTKLTTKGFAGARVAMGGLATAGGASAALLAKAFISGASDINESLNKNRVLFGRYAQDIDAFSKRSAGAFGISRAAALEYTGVFGNLFRAIGVSRGESAKFSVGLTKLAADMASFNNTSIEDALEAIRSGLVGETEPLRRFGVTLNDASLRTEALRKGIVDTTKNALTPQQRALAVQSLLWKQTTNAQGDARKTSGQLAGQMKILKAQTADLGAELGARLVPAATKGLRALNSLFKETSAGGRTTRAVSNWIKTAWKDASDAIKRFADRNQRDIRDVSRAMRSIGRVVAAVFREGIIPVVKLTARTFEGFAKGAIQVLRGLVRIIAGIVNGDWKRVWAGMKDIPLGVIKAIKASVGGLVKVIVAVIKAMVPASLRASKAIGTAIVKGIVSGIKSVPGAIADAISGIIPGGGKGGPPVGRFGKIGEGIGKVIGKDSTAALPSGKGAGSLMGALPGMAPFAAMAGKFGLSVTSGRRPGATTSSGNQSWHSTGEALDIGGPAPAMLAYFKLLKSRFGPRLAELIHTPGGAGISRGQSWVPTGQVAADHYDHVHVAYDLGTPGQGDGIGRRKPRTGDGVVGAFHRAIKNTKAPEKAALALFEAGIVESGLRNLNYGDADSIGALQLRVGIHGAALARSPYNSAVAFLRRGFTGRGGAIALSRSSRSAGMVAADVQGPAAQYRGRYDQVEAQARRYLQAVGKGAPKGGGGGGVAGGGGGGLGFYSGFSQAQQASQARVAKAVPAIGGVGVSAGVGGSGGYAGQVAGAQRIQAIGAARNNTATIVSGLQAEIKLKKKRIKLIRAVLKKRIRPARRKRLAAEEVELIEEIGTIAAALKEYRADARGGAAAAADAESDTARNEANLAADQEAASAEADRIANLPTAADYIQAKIDEASLTPDTADDKAALGELVGLRTAELGAARASGDPRRISEAISAYRAATEALNGVDDSAQRLAETMAALKDEMKRQNDIYQSVMGISSREAIRAMADMISGQIVGVGLQGRRQTAGTGATVLIP